MPVGAELLDGGELHHRLVVGHADHHHDADERHRVDALAGEPEEEDAARGGERNGRHHQQRRGEAGELAGEHEIDECDRQQRDDQQLVGRPLPLGVGTGDGPGQSGGRLEPCERAANVGAGTRGATFLDERLDYGDRPLVHAHHLDRRTGLRHRHELPHRHATDRRGQRCAEVFVRRSREAHADRGAAVGLAQLAGGHAAEPAGERSGHGIDGEPLPCDACPLERHLDLRLGAAVCVADIRQSRQPRERRAHSVRPPLGVVRLGRRHLDAHDAALASDQRAELRLPGEVERERAGSEVGSCRAERLSEPGGIVAVGHLDDELRRGRGAGLRAGEHLLVGRDADAAVDVGRAELARGGFEARGLAGGFLYCGAFGQLERGDDDAFVDAGEDLLGKLPGDEAGENRGDGGGSEHAARVGEAPGHAAFVSICEAEAEPREAVGASALARVIARPRSGRSNRVVGRPDRRGR